MELFGKVHVASETMANAGREALTFMSRHKKPCSDDIVVRAFHPTTGASRCFLLYRAEAEELHAALGKWLAEGWAGFVDGAPGPGEGYKEEPPTTLPAEPWWADLERKREERAERERKHEEAFTNTYASWTHEEMVQELRRLKWNAEVANTRAQRADEVAEHERERVRALFGRLRAALAGKRTASVDDLNAAIKEED
ncbi:hypothetical protein [Streptomyces sparsogenes]|uniref:hypothetical protein n=1 Tax=Streptomyces sparsogenes TaxID=67365 RepID=UPI00340490F1